MKKFKNLEKPDVTKAFIDMMRLIFRLGVINETDNGRGVYFTVAKAHNFYTKSLIPIYRRIHGRDPEN